MPSTALYYPHLTIDDSLLKLSLLYWDRIYRIVPWPLYEQLRDSHTLKQAAVRGALVNAQPEPYLGEVGMRFSNLMQPLLDAKGRKGLDPLLEGLEMDAFVDGGMRSDIHRTKLSGQAQNIMDQLASYEHDNGWLSVPTKVGGLYMTTLAAELSTQYESSLLTDNRRFADAGEYMLFARPERADADIHPQSLIAKLEIGFPTRRDLQHVPMKRIMKWHEDRAVERQRFRNMIEDVSQHLESMESSEAVEDYLHSKKLEYQQIGNDYYKSLDELKVKALPTALNVACPSSIMAVGSLAISGTLAAVCAGWGLALSGTAWFADYRGKRRQLAQQHPLHYALDVQKRTPNIWDRVHARLLGARRWRR